MKKVVKRKKKAIVIPAKTVIENCVFTGVKWEGLGVEIAKDISQAILNMTELFKSQNVEIKSLLTIGEDKEEKLK